MLENMGLPYHVLDAPDFEAECVIAGMAQAGITAASLSEDTDTVFMYFSSAGTIWRWTGSFQDFQGTFSKVSSAN